MKLQNGRKNPDRVNRQAAALERRQAEMQAWLTAPEDIEPYWHLVPEEEREQYVEEKVAKCQTDIANLESKLGIVHVEVE